MNRLRMLSALAKITVGSARLYSDEALREKLGIYREYGIDADAIFEPQNEPKIVGRAKHAAGLRSRGNRAAVRFFLVQEYSA